MTTISTAGLPQFSGSETLYKTAIETAIDTKEGTLTKGKATSDSNGEIAITGMTTNDGVVVTPLMTTVPFYVTVGTAKITIKKVSDDSPIASLTVGYCKV